MGIFDKLKSTMNSAVNNAVKSTINSAGNKKRNFHLFKIT